LLTNVPSFSCGIDALIRCKRGWKVPAAGALEITGGQRVGLKQLARSHTTPAQANKPDGYLLGS